MGLLDDRLKKAQEKANEEIKSQPYLNIDDFIKRGKFPPNCIFNFENVFRDVCVWYRNIKKIEVPDVTLWIMVRDTMLECFKKFGYSEPAFMDNVKKVIGYDHRNPTEDFHQRLADISRSSGMVGRLKNKKDNDAASANDKTADLAQKKIEKQFAEMGTLDAEALKTLKRTSKTTKDEDAFLKERREKYIRDFNLNDSSDATVLDQILNDELINRRFNIYLEANDNKFIAAAKTEVMDRLYKAFDVLGISRSKRKDAEDSAKDTFADAVETYEAMYTESRGDIALLFMIEELKMDLDKFDRGEMLEPLFIKNHSQEGFFSVEEARNWINQYGHLEKELDEKCSKIEL